MSGFIIKRKIHIWCALGLDHKILQIPAVFLDKTHQIGNSSHYDNTQVIIN